MLIDEIRNRILQGDALSVLSTIPDESVSLVMTSPPYWGLRDYAIEGQLGLESTPEAFLVRIWAIFDEVYRVLRKDGTVWINFGDSYISAKSRYSSKEQTISGKSRGEPDKGNRVDMYGHPFYQDKCLAMIPERFAIGMIERKWILLDVFGGTCTTALVAARANRDYIMIELSPAYIEIAQKRLEAVKLQTNLEFEEV